MKALLIVIPALLLSAPPSAAQQDTAKAGAYRASVSQTSLQAQTARMKDELAVIIRDYGRYEIAALEVTKLEETVAALDEIAAGEMPEIVRLLLEASHAPDGAQVRDRLDKADRGQKNIATRLRSLADRLALHADQAAMQRRIEELALRQAAALRTTRRLAGELADLGLTAERLKKEVAELPDSLSSPGRDDREGQRLYELNRRKQALAADWTRVGAEQSALEKEAGLALEAMAKVADDPLAPAVSHFRQALENARSGKLGEHTRQAAVAAEPAAAMAEQQAAFHALRSMIAALDGARPDEERLRDMAAQLADLSAKEEGLARRTPEVWGEQKNRSMRDQFEIGDRLEVLQDRIRSLDEENGAKAATAATQAEELGEALMNPDFYDNVPLVSRTADGQKQLAQELSALGKALESRANRLAAEGGAPASDFPPIRPEAAAIQAAMKELVDARIHVELASRQNREKLDYQPRVAQGRQNLARGSEQAEKAGDIVGEEVHKALADADQAAQTAAEGKNANHHLHVMRVRINDALAGLQEAAILLAAQEQQRQQGTGGENPFASGTQAGGPFFRHLAEASEAQRDALSLLKQEKTAPEYETMVNQYIKNLAEAPEDDR